MPLTPTYCTRRAYTTGPILTEPHAQRKQALAQRWVSPLLDVLIRAGLLLAMAMLCYQVLSPFLTLMVWALILAVTLYPLHQALARKVRGKQGLAATLLVVVGLVLIVVPTALLLSSLGDSVQQLIHDVQTNTLKIPAPRPSVATWPVVGKKLHDVWSQAHADLPALLQSMQPKIGELAKTALGLVASIGGGVLQFLASFIIAGIIIAFGQAGSRSSGAIFARLVGPARGSALARLSTATIRAAAQGVIGMARKSMHLATVVPSRAQEKAVDAPDRPVTPAGARSSLVGTVSTRGIARPCHPCSCSPRSPVHCRVS